MFLSNEAKPPDIKTQNNDKVIDPLTIWLIRIACFLIIVVFSGFLLGIPLAISFVHSFFNETVINAKEFLKNLIQLSLA